jgi:hypothetical protein
MRIAAWIAAIGATVALGTFAPAAATASGFTSCGNENTFVVAVFVKGVSCQHGFNVISHWKAKGCEHRLTSKCTWTAYFHDVRANQTYECTQSRRIDHRNRDYYAIACLSPDHTRDVRARDYPRGDYRPD